jgi:septal ring factor EnvC (AmiA/AmiB activator)
MASVKSAPNIIIEASDPRAVRRLAIAASPRVTKQAAPLTLDSVKARAEALNSAAKDLLSAQKRHKVETATGEQVRQIACLVDLRQKRKELEAQIAAIASDETAIAGQLKNHMTEHEIGKIVSPIGSYCYEPRSGGVSVRMPCDAYTLRT